MAEEKSVTTAAGKTVEDIVKHLNTVNNISLDMTQQMMCDTDYKIRFVAEYVQTKIRYNSLHSMIVKMDANTLEFEPTCPRITLANQKSAMGNYLNQLEIRAEIEKIPLPKI